MKEDTYPVPVSVQGAGSSSCWNCIPDQVGVFLVEHLTNIFILCTQSYHARIRKMKRFLERAIIHASNKNGCLYVLGDGRSGTTWLAQILNYNDQYVEFVEPYHGWGHLNLPDNRLYPTVGDIGRLGLDVNCWEQLSSQLPKSAGLTIKKRFPPPLAGVLVKDISAHLVLDLLNKNNARKLYIIRNPISVAMSKEKYGRWHAPADISMLLQACGFNDNIGQRCLSDGLVTTEFQEYIFVWCLLHRHALPVVVRSSEYFVLFYEDVLRNTEASIAEIFRWIGEERQFEKYRSSILDCAGAKSRTVSGDCDFLSNRFLEQPWEGRKEAEAIEQAHEIVRRFGLDSIYGETLEPKICSRCLKAVVNQWL